MDVTKYKLCNAFTDICMCMQMQTGVFNEDFLKRIQSTGPHERP